MTTNASGAASVTYTAPNPLPAGGATVTVHAVATLADGTTVAIDDVTIALVQGVVAVTRDSSGGTASVNPAVSDCASDIARSPDGATEFDSGTVTCTGETNGSATSSMSFTETYDGTALVGVTASSSSTASDGAAASADYGLQFTVAQTTLVTIDAELIGGTNGTLDFRFFRLNGGVSIIDQDGGPVDETLTLVPGQYILSVTAVSGGNPPSGLASFDVNLTFGP